jgi:hypothetical protein
VSKVKVFRRVVTPDGDMFILPPMFITIASLMLSGFLLFVAGVGALSNFLWWVLGITGVACVSSAITARACYLMVRKEHYEEVK